MFYSQIILAKKGTLGKIWTAAHWGDKKMGRAQIFSTDISNTVDSIVHPTVPLALRLSGVLLLGVVRIYSRQVKYLMLDCQEAMGKIQNILNASSSFMGDGRKDEEEKEYDEGDEEDKNARKRKRKSHTATNLNVSNFGEYSMTLDPTHNFVDSSGRMLIQPIVLVEHDDDNPMPTADMMEDMFRLARAAGGEWFVEHGDDLDGVDKEEDSLLLDPSSTGRKSSKKGRDTSPRLKNNSMALAAVNLTLDSDLSGILGGYPSSSGRRSGFIQDEGWQAFDPEMEDEEFTAGGDVLDENARRDTSGRNTSRTSSTLSDIERVRAMEDSRSTDITSRFPRPSLASSDIMEGPTPTDADPSFVNQSPVVSENEFPIIQEDDHDVSGIPFEDSIDIPSATRDSLDSVHGMNQNRLSLGHGMEGLDQDLSLEEDQEQQVGEQDKEEESFQVKTKTKRIQKNPIPSSGPKRLRKKRKIAYDDAIHLSSDHMRNMLKDTSDIVLQNRSHPADYIQPSSVSSTQDEDEAVLRNFSISVRKRRRFRSMERTPHHSDPEDVSNLSYDILLTRPNISDSGMLAPALLNLWLLNAARLRGNDQLPFRMQNTLSVAQQDTCDQREGEHQDVEEMETTRRKRDTRESMDENDRLSLDFQHSKENLDDEPEFSNAPYQPDDDEFPTMSSPLEASLGNPMVMNSDGTFPPCTDDAVQNDQSGNSPLSQGDFSLGAVNDLEDEFRGYNDDDRGGLDDSADASIARTSTSKWHKHTVKVLTMLQKNMTNRDSLSVEKDSLSNVVKSKVLSYNTLTMDSSRRTAVAVFFELLQLKTWDFIDLKQTESYGDIQITSGPRFLEDPPTA